MLQKQQELYDDEYRKLPRTFAGFENWRLSYIQRISRALDLRQGDRFLDVGVGGTGFTVLAAAQIGAYAIGTEISMIACRAAFAYAGQLGVRKAASFLAASATNLPFASGTFDKVVCNAVLEHVEEDDAAIDELCRVTAPRGRLLLCVPNTYLTMHPLLALLNLYNDRRVGHIRHYAAQDLVLRLKRRGLRAIDVTYHGHVIKVAQLVLDRCLMPGGWERSRVWWHLERGDLAQGMDPSAVNVSVTFERAT